MANLQNKKQSDAYKAKVGIENRVIVILILAVILLMLVIILVIFLRLPNELSNHVFINGINLYTGLKSGNSTTNSSTAISVTYSPQKSSVFHPTFILYNPYFYDNITINNIKILTPGFVLNSVNPQLPFNLSAGSNITVSLDVVAPISEYNGTLSIQVQEAGNGSNSSFYFNGTGLSTIIINGINFQINYENSSSKYFGKTSQFYNESAFVTNFNQNGTFTLPIYLSNNDSISHVISSINISTPGFTILGIQPVLPYKLGANNASVEMQLYIETPNKNFTGPLTITVNTK